jgi:hypothetical protein
MDMSDKRVIKAKKIAADIRSRVSDFEMMSKYDLSPDQLEWVLAQLVGAGVLRSPELTERGTYFDEPTNRCQTRRFSREYLRLPAPIADLIDQSNKGLVTDISENGFRVRGLAAQVGDDKVMVISGSGNHSEGGIVVRAQCKWVKKELPDKRLHEAGFEITLVSTKDLSGIRRLMRALGLGDSNIGRKR